MSKKRLHMCHIPACGKIVPRAKLMCGRHWAMVPIHLRLAVVRAFNPEQCRPQSKVRPTDEWLKAARAAINAVIERERDDKPKT